MAAGSGSGASPRTIEATGTTPLAVSASIPASVDSAGVSERVEVALASDVASSADTMPAEQARVEDLEVVAERIDAHGVGPVDPRRRARRVDLGHHQRVEVPAHALDVGREEGDAAVLGVEEGRVEVHVPRHPLVEGGPYHLDDIGNRGLVAVDLDPRPFDTEAAR